MGKPIHYLFLFTFIFVAVVSSVMFHESGIPESITEAEKAHVMATWGQADVQMENVVNKFQQFIDHPDNQCETSLELAKAVDEWNDTMEFMRNEPTFSFPDPEAIEAGQKVLAKIEGELDTVSTSNSP
jgi:hypothetical protein